MPKKKKPAEKPADQFKRFIETAREHGVDESGRQLDEAFKRVAKSTSSRSNSPKSEQS